MMFCLRAIMVALGFFGVMYCLLSLLIMCVWRGTRLLCRNSAGGLARALFAARIFPVVGSAFITLAFAVPAFLLLEPAAIDEDIGTLLFSACTLLLLSAGLIRVVAAQAKASRTVADWIEGVHALDARATGSTWQARRVPPLLLYGVAAPRVLASETAITLLSPEELRVAVRHEIGHMRSRDNLKKLLVYAASFPGMANLEQAWQDAAEFAADEAAVSNSDDAVDLASALIKLADAVPSQELPAFTTGLMDCAALVRVRVQRLLDWDESCGRGVPGRSRCLLALALLAVSYTVAHYGQALSCTHRFTEWLIG
jgi:Zn-dependent protease with chaperone function